MGIAVQECLYIEELYICLVYVDRKKGRYFFIVSHVKFDIENKKERKQHCFVVYHFVRKQNKNLSNNHQDEKAKCYSFAHVACRRVYTLRCKLSIIVFCAFQYQVQILMTVSVCAVA